MPRRSYSIPLVLSLATAAGLWLWRRQRAMARPSNPDPLTLIQEPATPLTVTRLPDDGLRVQWAADLLVVRLFTSPDPALVEELHLAAEHPAQSHAVLQGLDPAVRHYVLAELADGRRLVTAERILPLPSAINLRDIGGYATKDGRFTRWGQLYRSGDFSSMGGDDVRYLERLGLRLICDLRTTEEKEKLLSRLPGNPQLTYRHTPIYERQQGSGHWLKVLMSNRHALNEVWQNDIYIQRFVERGAESFGRVLTLLADGRHRPALVHCTAGKDRTGIAIALLLAVLGVDEATIVADYTLSNRYYQAIYDTVAADAQRLAVVGIQTADLFPILTAPAHILRGALAHINQTHGSVENYLVTRAAVDPATLVALRDAFLSAKS